ncbi:hypothetical protein ACFU76_03960 [Streptomyces sp. NPDC057539]|uniref:hypothetical protein n=1 Tax=Streptomyces sp. NPDC057539 TaxID=3346159 RepID=UPI00368EDBB4
MTTAADPMALPAYEALCVTGEEHNCGAESGTLHTPDELTRWIAEHCARIRKPSFGRPENRVARGGVVLTVEADPAWVEMRVAAGELLCPACEGLLRRWGWACSRVLRDVAGGLVVVRRYFTVLLVDTGGRCR